MADFAVDINWAGNNKNFRCVITKGFLRSVIMYTVYAAHCTIDNLNFLLCKHTCSCIDFENRLLSLSLPRHIQQCCSHKDFSLHCLVRKQTHRRNLNCFPPNFQKNRHCWIRFYWVSSLKMHSKQSNMVIQSKILRFCKSYLWLVFEEDKLSESKFGKEQNSYEG